MRLQTLLGAPTQNADIVGVAVRSRTIRPSRKYTHTELGMFGSADHKRALSLLPNAKHASGTRVAANANVNKAIYDTIQHARALCCRIVKVQRCCRQWESGSLAARHTATTMQDILNAHTYTHKMFKIHDEQRRFSHLKVKWVQQ